MIKNTKKDSGKNHVKVKGEKRSEIGIKIFLKKENKTNVSIRKNII